MNKIYLVGDTHIPIDIAKLNSLNFPIGKKLDKKDFVIVLGDFGLLWEQIQDKEELNWTKWLGKKAWTTLFIDGNHENFTRLYSLPDVKMFGKKVGKVSDSIFYLKRGEIYNICDKKFFTFGGASSIDKIRRTINVSWWQSEVASQTEMNYGLQQLEKNNYEVDYVLTHTAPESIIQIYLEQSQFNPYMVKDATTNYLDEVLKKIKFKKWFFGHWHSDWKYKKFNMLYEKKGKIL